MIDPTTAFFIVAAVIIFIIWLIYRDSKSSDPFKKRRNRNGRTKSRNSSTSIKGLSPHRQRWDNQEKEADKQRGTGEGSTVSHVETSDKDSFGRPIGGYVENYSNGKTSIYKPK